MKKRKRQITLLMTPSFSPLPPSTPSTPSQQPCKTVRLTAAHAHPTLLHGLSVCMCVCVSEHVYMFMVPQGMRVCVCVHLYVCARTLGQAAYTMIHTLKEAYFLSLFKWSSVAAADVLSIALLVVAGEVRVAVLSGSCVCVCSVSVPSERVTSAE